ncbi:hypothetical protein HMSSN036_78830 [Paenibacillus macerans]|nr:hypothetical protein HMSSN036_78830 [Paenibacillus macerans]
MPTATSVVADLVAVVKNLKLGVNGLKQIVPYKPKKLKTDEQIAYKNFLLLHVDDKAGVLAQITQVFAEYGVSLESVVQSPNTNVDGAEIMIVTHNASKASMDKVINHFESLGVIHRIKSIYRVEG